MPGRYLNVLFPIAAAPATTTSTATEAADTASHALPAG